MFRSSAKRKSREIRWRKAKTRLRWIQLKFSTKRSCQIFRSIWSLCWRFSLRRHQLRRRKQKASTLWRTFCQKTCRWQSHSRQSWASMWTGTRRSSWKLFLRYCCCIWSTSKSITCINSSSCRSISFSPTAFLLFWSSSIRASWHTLDQRTSFRSWTFHHAWLASSPS